MVKKKTDRNKSVRPSSYFLIWPIHPTACGGVGILGSYVKGSTHRCIIRPVHAGMSCVVNALCKILPYHRTLSLQGPFFLFIKYILPRPRQSHTEYVTKTKGIEGGREDERRNTRNRKMYGRNDYGHRSRKTDIRAQVLRSIPAVLDAFTRKYAAGVIWRDQQPGSRARGNRPGQRGDRWG